MGDISLLTVACQWALNLIDSRLFTLNVHSSSPSSGLILQMQYNNIGKRPHCLNEGRFVRQSGLASCQHAKKGRHIVH